MKNIIFNIYNKQYSVDFDFCNNKITCNGKTKKVVNDLNYTYKIQKTQIKARRGINGLYEFMCHALTDDFYSTWVNTICESFN